MLDANTPENINKLKPTSKGFSGPHKKPIKSKEETMEYREHKEVCDTLEGAARSIIKSTPDSLEREGLSRTPARFAKAMNFLLQGYHLTPQKVVGEGVFSSEGGGLVSVNNIEFYSMCEHHILPFWGNVTIAYYPENKILGLSKFPRIIDIYARRLQVQERLTREIVQATHELINPRAVMVRIKASHLCMMMRGVEKQQSFTITEYALGLDKLSPLETDRLMAVFSEQK